MKTKLDVYKEVWCVIRYGDTDINEVYIDKDAAILAAHDSNESMKEIVYYNPKARKHEVKVLWDAIEWVKEAIEDQRAFDEYYN